MTNVLLYDTLFTFNNDRLFFFSKCCIETIKSVVALVCTDISCCSTNWSCYSVVCSFAFLLYRYTFDEILSWNIWCDSLTDFTLMPSSMKLYAEIVSRCIHHTLGLTWNEIQWIYALLKGCYSAFVLQPYDKLLFSTVVAAISGTAWVWTYFLFRELIRNVKSREIRSIEADFFCLFWRESPKFKARFISSFFFCCSFNLQKYSADYKRMFRHDRLTRGICMDWCRKRMKTFSTRTRMSYYIDNFENDTSIYQDPNTHTHALIDRGRYYRYATQCVNYELKNQYGLVAQSQIRYCVTNKDTDQDTYGWYIRKCFFLFHVFCFFNITINCFYFFQMFFFADWLDCTYVVLCTVIMILIVASTSYDFHLKRNNLPHLCNREHYKRRVEANTSKCNLYWL